MHTNTPQGENHVRSNGGQLQTKERQTRLASVAGSWSPLFCEAIVLTEENLYQLTCRMSHFPKGENVSHFSTGAGFLPSTVVQEHNEVSQVEKRNCVE